MQRHISWRRPGSSREGVPIHLRPLALSFNSSQASWIVSHHLRPSAAVRTATCIGAGHIRRSFSMEDGLWGEKARNSRTVLRFTAFIVLVEDFRVPCHRERSLPLVSLTGNSLSARLRDAMVGSRRTRDENQPDRYSGKASRDSMALREKNLEWTCQRRSRERGAAEPGSGRRESRYPCFLRPGWNSPPAIPLSAPRASGPPPRSRNRGRRRATKRAQIDMTRRYARSDESRAGR